MRTIDWYRSNWPRLAAAGAAGLTGVLAATGHRMDRSRALSLAGLAALGAHQTEEYIYPGWFPGLLNRDVRHSDHPRNYPGNAHNSMLVNTAAYPFYALPVFFPNSKPLGLAQVMFGFVELLGHAVAMPIMARRPYTPGEATSLLLFAPIGRAWIAEQRHRGGISRNDVAAAAGLVALFSLIGVALPQALTTDRDSPYTFTDYQARIPAGIFA